MILKRTHIKPFKPFVGNENGIKGVDYYIYVKSLTDRLNVVKDENDTYLKGGECYLEVYNHMRGLFEGNILDWRIFEREGDTGYMYDLLQRDHKNLLSKKILLNLREKVEEVVDHLEGDATDSYTVSEVTPHHLWYCNTLKSVALKLNHERVFDGRFFEDRSKNKVHYINPDKDFILKEVKSIQAEVGELVESSSLPDEGDYELLNDYLIKWQFVADRKLLTEKVLKV